MDRIKSQMSLSGPGKFIKYSIFVVNFLLFLGGLAVMGLGIWVLADRPPSSKVLNGNVLVDPSAILLAFGCILAFVTFLGCCGAIMENKCLLSAFLITVLIITILIIVGVVLLAKNKDQIAVSLKADMINSIDHYPRDEDTRQAWDYIQNNFRCCGVTKSSDWRWKVPSSCKCTYAPECDQEDYYVDLYWQMGCAERMQELVAKLSTPLIVVASIVIAVLFLSMVFTFSLLCMLSRKK